MEALSIVAGDDHFALEKALTFPTVGCYVSRENIKNEPKKLTDRRVKRDSHGA